MIKDYLYKTVKRISKTWNILKGWYSFGYSWVQTRRLNHPHTFLIEGTLKIHKNEYCEYFFKSRPLIYLPQITNLMHSLLQKLHTLYMGRIRWLLIVMLMLKVKRFMALLFVTQTYHVIFSIPMEPSGCYRISSTL